MKPNYSICFISPSTIHRSIGGAEVQIQILSNEMAKRNKKVYLLTAPDQIPPDDNSAIEYVPFKEVENYEINVQTFSDLLYKIKPDILYQRGRKLWTWYTGQFAKQSNSKFIFAASMDIDCYKTKLLFRKPRSAYEAYKRVKKFKKNYKIDELTLKGMKAANRILAQTNMQKHLLTKNLKLESTIFPNLHPSEDLNEIKKNSPPTIVWIANLKKWKQPEVFLKLVEEHNNLHAKFIMAGNLSDSSYADLIDKVKKVNKNFSYLGPITFEKSNELLNQATIFINTSGMEEGFPNTFIQSWLRKTPTITLNFDPDCLIEENQLGFKADDYDGLVTYIKMLLDNSTLRKEMGNNAYTFAKKNFSIENKMDEFIKLIEN